MKSILAIVLIVALVATVSYGCWQLERYFHYKFGYQALVMAEINRSVLPLEARVKQLEAEVQNLKTNR